MNTSNILSIAILTLLVTPLRALDGHSHSLPVEFLDASEEYEPIEPSCFSSRECKNFSSIDCAYKNLQTAMLQEQNMNLVLFDMESNIHYLQFNHQQSLMLSEEQLNNMYSVQIQRRKNYEWYLQREKLVFFNYLHDLRFQDLVTQRMILNHLTTQHNLRRMRINQMYQEKHQRLFLLQENLGLRPATAPTTRSVNQVNFSLHQ